MLEKNDSVGYVCQVIFYYVDCISEDLAIKKGFFVCEILFIKVFND